MLILSASVTEISSMCIYFLSTPVTLLGPVVGKEKIKTTESSEVWGRRKLRGNDQDSLPSFPAASIGVGGVTQDLST